MNDIKTIKLALMKEGDWTDEDRMDFDLRYSGLLDVKQILEQQIGNVNESNYDEFIPEILKLIFEELVESASKENADVDSCGIWIDYGDDTDDNSIKLSVLRDIENYGTDSINPVYEFYKMTLSKRMN